MLQSCKIRDWLASAGAQAGDEVVFTREGHVYKLSLPGRQQQQQQQEGGAESESEPEWKSDGSVEEAGEEEAASEEGGSTDDNEEGMEGEEVEGACAAQKGEWTYILTEKARTHGRVNVTSECCSLGGRWDSGGWAQQLPGLGCAHAQHHARVAASGWAARATR